MKHMFACGIVVLGISSVASGQHNHMQMVEMLRDSVMMDHIAPDNQKRSVMMDKMIYYAIGDTAKMTEMCKKMIDNKRMLSFLRNMIDERNKSHKTKKEK